MLYSFPSVWRQTYIPTCTIPSLIVGCVYLLFSFFSTPVKLLFDKEKKHPKNKILISQVKWMKSWRRVKNQIIK